MESPPTAPSAGIPEASTAGRAAGRVYSGLQSEERARERYLKLVEAGIEVFGAIGYASAKVKTLCQSAGLSERYFYESFESREHLLTVVYDTLAKQLMERVTAALQDPEAELHQAVRESMAAVVNFMLDDPRNAQIMLVEIVGISAEMEVKRHRSLMAFADQSRGALLLLSGIDPKIVGQQDPAAVHAGTNDPPNEPAAVPEPANALPPAVDTEHPLATALDFARLTAISMVGGVNNMLLDAVLCGTTGNTERITEVSYQLIHNASFGIRAIVAAAEAEAGI